MDLNLAVQLVDSEVVNSAESSGSFVVDLLVTQTDSSLALLKVVEKVEQLDFLWVVYMVARME